MHRRRNLDFSNLEIDLQDIQQFWKIICQTISKTSWLYSKNFKDYVYTCKSKEHVLQVWYENENSIKQSKKKHVHSRLQIHERQM